jgi:hypothetical protein
MSALLQALLGGELNALTLVVWTLIAMLLSLAAGAAAGVVLAGKDLGNSLAAMMGGMFGPVAAAPGILVGLLLLAWL